MNLFDVNLSGVNWCEQHQFSKWGIPTRQLVVGKYTEITAPELLEGIVEIDETYVGGSQSNKHASKRTVKGGAGGKAMVLGAVERGGNVKTRVIAKIDADNVLPTIKEFVAPVTIMVTDEHNAYNKLHLDFTHTGRPFKNRLV
ncbi:transposase [Mucilaginibacter sp.]|nr:transposase [Mucilaginibacter sp.]